MSTSFLEDGLPQASYRSGEAARLAQMPVARLRLWERRYDVIGPAKSTSGQRLYSEDDIRRLALINGLVNRGHAIGAIARLEREQLEVLVAKHVPTVAIDRSGTGSSLPFRLTVVGESLQRGLAETGIELEAYGIAETLVYHDMAAAREGATAENGKTNILLLRMPFLHAEQACEVLALGDIYSTRRVAVVYGFGRDSAAESLRLAGVRLYRDPHGRSELRQMLSDLCHGAKVADIEGEGVTASRVPRRYDDEELEVIAAHSSTIACECPGHLVELVTQLSTFEAYSNECTSRSSRDEALHRFLGDTANRARALIEAALARVVREEGLSTQPEKRV